jgi:hypothetical protein
MFENGAHAFPAGTHRAKKTSQRINRWLVRIICGDRAQITLS